MLSRMISASIGCSVLLGLFGTGIAGTDDDNHHFKLWALHKHEQPDNHHFKLLALHRYEQTVIISANSQDSIGRSLISNNGELSIDCTSKNPKLSNTYRILTISMADTALAICKDTRIAIYPGQHVRQKLKTQRHNWGVQYEIAFFLTKQSDAETGAYWSTKCVLTSRGLTIMGTIHAPKTCFR